MAFILLALIPGALMQQRCRMDGGRMLRVGHVHGPPGLETGIDDYLSKPLSRADLTTVLARWVPGPGPAR